jgi:small-conductance mechanosensitive channel
MKEFLEAAADALHKLADFTLFQSGGVPITVASILTLLVFFGVVVLGERMLRRWLILPMLGRTRMDPAVRYAVGKILGYLVIAFGFYIAFLLVGINLSSLAILAGAVGVGLGFGLQNIINNFVSGLIILAERPIAIGDHVEIGGVDGTVQRISLRSTTVLTNDNIAIIVPNADFITHSVTNWSYADPRVGFRLPVGVAYGTDVEKLRMLLLEAAQEHPKALKDPAPTVHLTGFGDSALNFELVVWTQEMTHRPRQFRSDLNFAIERKLRENHIEIPFPQRDLHLRTGTFVLQPPSTTQPGRQA